MKRLALFIKPYWKTAVLAPTLICIETILDLLQPTLAAKIIDKGIKSGDTQLIIRTTLIMIFIAFIGLLGGFGCTLTACTTSQYFGADLRAELYKKVQKFSFTNIDEFKTASIITRLTNDVAQVQAAVLLALRVMIRAPLLCIGGAAFAFALNARLSIIILCTIPLLSLTLYFIIIKSFPLFSKVQEKLDRVNAVIRENLLGVRVVKAFVREDLEKSRFSEANIGLMEMTVKATKIVSLNTPILLLIMNVSIIAVLWFGGIQYNSGTISIGQIIAFINYLTQILSSLMMLAMILTSLSRAKASVIRIQELLNADIDISDDDIVNETPITKGKIEFENVSFCYRGSNGDNVLSNITVTFEPGKTVAILGATGAGKSTLVNLIPRLYNTTEGVIKIDDKPINHYKIKTLRNKISIVFQESILFTGSIRDNLKWGNENATDEEIIEAAKAAAAHGFIMKFPEGYDTKINQRGLNLSGGQKQRVSIARALLKKPAILILDDSTSAVDIFTELRIQKNFKGLAKNCTLIVIAQRISSVVDADKIIVIENGHIVGEGTHKELIKTSSVYKEIYKSQFGEDEAVNG
ncbi:MAG: ABC transporter ATP-binding protein [Clostridiaceae bacterium]